MRFCSLLVLLVILTIDIGGIQAYSKKFRGNKSKHGTWKQNAIDIHRDRNTKPVNPSNKDTSPINPTNRNTPSTRKIQSSAPENNLPKVSQIDRALERVNKAVDTVNKAVDTVNKAVDTYNSVNEQIDKIGAIFTGKTSTPDTLQPEVDESQHTSINRDYEDVTSSDASHYQTQPSVSENSNVPGTFSQAPQQHQPVSTQNPNWPGTFPLGPQQHNPFGYLQNPNWPGPFPLGPQQRNPFGYLQNPNWPGTFPLGPQQRNPFSYPQNPKGPNTFSNGSMSNHQPQQSPQSLNLPGTGISVGVYNYGYVNVGTPTINIHTSKASIDRLLNGVAARSQVATG